MILLNKQTLKSLKKRKVRLPRPPKNGPLITQERDYFRAIELRLNFIRDLVNRELMPYLVDIVNTAKAERGDASDFRTDAITTQIRRRFQGIETQFAEKYTETDLERTARSQAGNILQASDKVSNKIMQKVVGIDVVQNLPGGQAASEAFVRENISLIKSVQSDLVSSLEKEVLQTVRRGTRVEVLRKNIENRFGVSKSRASLIARDQVNKFNGQLNEMRYKRLGISSYIWRTVGDERVRLSHADLEGKTFTWNEPPSVGHPGEDFQCRCQAEPVIDIFNEIDNE